MGGSIWAFKLYFGEFSNELLLFSLIFRLFKKCYYFHFSINLTILGLCEVLVSNLFFPHNFRHFRKKIIKIFDLGSFWRFFVIFVEFWVDFMFLSLFWDIFEKYENLILNSYMCLVDRIWLLLLFRIKFSYFLKIRKET